VSPAGRRRRTFWPLIVLVGGFLVVALGGTLLIRHGSAVTQADPVPTVSAGVVGPITPVQLPAGRDSPSSDPTAVAPPPGSRVVVPALGMAAPLEPVGAPGNVMTVPLDPHVLGWWNGGAVPGSGHGNVIVVGHVNFNGVSGALSMLPRTHVGDTVTITEPHSSYRYRISALRTYPKNLGLPPSTFSSAGAEQLVLITCGGPFDPVSGNYVDNIVAYAAPVR
jgi:hypothetical protein